MACHATGSMTAFFFFNDTATTEIYTLSLHDALPIYGTCGPLVSLYGVFLPFENSGVPRVDQGDRRLRGEHHLGARSEEHTSELQSRQYLVCRLLLEKKIKKYEEDLDAVTDTN